LRTEVRDESARSVIARNDSPDLPFDYSINPYRGCEHGCVYCYARPTHEYLGLSAGLDFETRLTAKANAAQVLRRELAQRTYRPSPINLGAATDPYQPLERECRITRSLLEVFLETRHPLTIVTKNALVLRDLDLLRELAAARLVEVNLSVTTLDNRLAARLEPRASAPHARLRAVAELAAAGVPVGVFVAPVIPALTDAELESVMAAAAEAGAQWLSYSLIRLPHGVAGLFREWLAAHFPDRAAHVMSLLQQIRGGRDNDPRFGTRMRGEGAFAELIRQRFERRRRALGLAGERMSQLDTSAFRPPVEPSPQGDLFA
jgi:DNA repair photolyase